MEKKRRPLRGPCRSPRSRGRSDASSNPLLSYQPAETVLLEVARHDLDAAADSDLGEERVGKLKARADELFLEQLASALNAIPDEDRMLSCGIIP